MSTPDDVPEGLSSEGLGRPSQDDPSGFSRPSGWGELPDDGQGADGLVGQSAAPLNPPVGPAAPSPGPSGPEFVPSADGHPTPPGRTTHSTSRRKPQMGSIARRRAELRRAALRTQGDTRLVRSLLGRTVLVLVAITAALLLVLPHLVDRPTGIPGRTSGSSGLGGPQHTPRPYPPSPLPSSALSTPLPESATRNLAPTWQVSPATLRPELSSASVLSPDNDPDGDSYVIDAGKSWVVLTGNVPSAPRDWEQPAPDLAVKLHALDAATGAESWSRSLSGGLCAMQLLDGRLVCLEVVDRDRATGMGSRWRALLIDPATGRESVSRVVEASVVRIGVESGHVILVEQREPSPKLVVRSLSPRLVPEWSLDLSGQRLHDDWFTSNRMVVRSDLARPDGQALGKVRLRTVGKGTLALWSTGPSAFIDPAKGRLLAMVRCSRLVDDGTRLWCNEHNFAQSYDYTLKPLVTTQHGVRLGHPDHDRRHGDVTVPLFLDSESRCVSVDGATGATKGVLVDTSSSETFGGKLDPSVQQSGTAILVRDSDGLIALDPTGRRALWATTQMKFLDRMWLAGDRLVLVDRPMILVLDPVTGAVRDQLSVPGSHLLGIGSQLVGDPRGGVLAVAGHTGGLARIDLGRS